MKYDDELFPRTFDDEEVEETYVEHDTLNPALFNSDEHLKPEIVNKLMQIVEAFVEDSEVLSMEDVITAHFVGSNASYNYTDKSDIDLHIVVDMSELSSDELMAQIAANGEKALFNKRYDIKLNGFDVEVYVEDMNADVKSNGIYDIFEDEWVRHPEFTSDGKEHFNFDFLLDQAIKTCENKAKGTEPEEIQNYINSLYVMRREALAKGGEPSDGNQVFKELRNLGYLDMLRDRVAQLKSQELSLTEAKDKSFTTIKWTVWIPNSFLSHGVKKLISGYGRNQKDAEKKATKAILKYLDSSEELQLHNYEYYDVSQLDYDILDFNPYEQFDDDNILKCYVMYPWIKDDEGDMVEGMVVTLDFLDY